MRGEFRETKGHLEREGIKIQREREWGDPETEADGGQGITDTQTGGGQNPERQKEKQNKRNPGRGGWRWCPEAPSSSSPETHFPFSLLRPDPTSGLL